MHRCRSAPGRIRSTLLLWLFTACVLDVPPAAAAVYKCVAPDGSVSYLDHACDPNAQSATVQISQARASPASSGLDIRSASYISPRNGRALDVTAQIRARCASTAGSCMVSCGNDLAGDPDLGQQKYCQISYQCADRRPQTLQLKGD
jgi:hypothetical protein